MIMVGNDHGCLVLVRQGPKDLVIWTVTRRKSWTSFGPVPGCGRAIWSTQGGYGPVGSCGRAMGLDNQSGFGFDVSRSGGRA
ncbi:hypothetical protein Bca101_067631 [Brassica carinata]